MPPHCRFSLSPSLPAPGYIDTAALPRSRVPEPAFCQAAASRTLMTCPCTTDSRGEQLSYYDRKRKEIEARSYIPVNASAEKKPQNNRDHGLLVIPGTISQGICPILGQHVRIQVFGKRSTKDNCLWQCCMYTSVPEHSCRAGEGMGKISGYLADRERTSPYSRGKEGGHGGGRKEVAERGCAGSCPLP